MIIWLPDLTQAPPYTQHFKAELNNDFTFVYREHFIYKESDVDKLGFKNMWTGFFIDCRFQILFELALNSLARGYLRDAVVSFTAALERYQEFYLMTVFLQKNGDLTVFTQFWKKVSSQTERQYGAYLALSSLALNSLPPILSNSEVAFRNKVVHKGFFPSEENTKNYGLTVLRIIASGLKKMLETSEINVMNTIELEVQNRRPERDMFELSINPFMKIVCQSLYVWEKEFKMHIEKLQKSSDEIIWPNDFTRIT